MSITVDNLFLHSSQDSKSLRVALKPPVFLHAVIKSALAVVAKWGMTKVVSQPSKFNKIQINRMLLESSIPSI
mgnify:CR=1 FL=1